MLFSTEQTLSLKVPKPREKENHVAWGKYVFQAKHMATTYKDHEKT